MSFESLFACRIDDLSAGQDLNGECRSFYVSLSNPEHTYICALVYNWVDMRACQNSVFWTVGTRWKFVYGYDFCGRTMRVSPLLTGDTLSKPLFPNLQQYMACSRGLKCGDGHHIFSPLVESWGAFWWLVDREVGSWIKVRIIIQSKGVVLIGPVYLSGPYSVFNRITNWFWRNQILGHVTHDHVKAGNTSPCWRDHACKGQHFLFGPLTWRGNFRLTQQVKHEIIHGSRRTHIYTGVESRSNLDRLK